MRTKAQNLSYLKPKLKLANVPPLITFKASKVQSNLSGVLDELDNWCGGRRLICVRSSTGDEDGLLSAKAGEYESVLDIQSNNSKKITNAFKVVLESISKKRKVTELDEIFVQDMVCDVDMSGVLFTRELNSGSPYYVVNYDDQSGRTDTVTSGGSEYSNRTMYVFRDRYLDIKSPRHKYLINAVREIEKVLNSDSLDIEFIVDKNNIVHILQVRPISTKHTWNDKKLPSLSKYLETAEGFLRQRFKRMPDVLGETTVLGQMPDWNPVEMIGRAPTKLSYSIYEAIITNSSWRKARSIMGYREPQGFPLMTCIGGQPYIDTRLSFNSFLPATLDKKVGEKLVNFWIERLKDKPSLHDKVEFDIAITSFDFDIEDRINRNMPGLLTLDEKRHLVLALKKLTKNLIKNENEGSIEKALKKIEILRGFNKEFGKDNTHHQCDLHRVIEVCNTFGTIPFSILARHGFIAQGFLRSLEQKGIMNELETHRFLTSFSTIAGDLVNDLRDLKEGKISSNFFFEKYGHLRPGTYNIEAPRYDQMKDKIVSNVKPEDPTLPSLFNIAQKKKEAINKLLAESGFEDFDCNDLFEYIRNATVAREYSKFIFTRTVSDLLETVASIGAGLGLNRSEMTHVDIIDLLHIEKETTPTGAKNYLSHRISHNRDLHATSSFLRFPQIISEESNVYVMPIQINSPNFVTQKYIQSEIVLLTNFSENIDLDGKIVLIESADPGFDWIFSYKIAGLITKFGGANSHMAIRCAEFALPAAIGCGDQRFLSYSQANEIILDCASSSIAIVS